MDIKEIKNNSRVQIEVEKSNPDTVIEAYRGIIMESHNDSITMVTDFGKKVGIKKDDILSISKCGFDRHISQSMMKLKSFYMERQELTRRIEELSGKEGELIESLLDANMLSRFNLLGARNRLHKSIPQELVEFSRGIYIYTVEFKIGEKRNLEIWFRVSNVLDNYPSEVNIDNLIRTHAPDETKLLEKTFIELGIVEPIENSVIHVEDSIYEIISTYRIKTAINKENYIKMRTQIVEGLIGLRK